MRAAVISTRPRPALVLALLLSLAAPALAESTVVDVSAHASFATVQQGGFQDVDCLIENVSTEPVLVMITAFVTYADGDVQTFRALQQGPILIEPDGAFFLSIGFAVPEDAALGTATFTCSVRVVGPVAAGETEAAAATFDVAPA